MLKGSIVLSYWVGRGVMKAMTAQTITSCLLTVVEKFENGAQLGTVMMDNECIQN